MPQLSLPFHKDPQMEIVLHPAVRKAQWPKLQPPHDFEVILKSNIHILPVALLKSANLAAKLPKLRAKMK